MAFFTAFKIDFVSLVWYLVVFLIAGYLLKWLFYQPILNLLEERQKKVNDSLDEAQQARDSVKRNRERAEKVLWEASQEAQEIVRRAEKAASDIQTDARREARTQQEAMIAKARTEIEQERLAAISDIRRQVVDLALVAAASVIKENLDADRNRRLVEEAITQAEISA